MKCYRKGLLGCLVLVALFGFFNPSNTFAEEIGVIIDVSPNVLNIGSSK